MKFENEKKQALQKILKFDNSKKGNIDEQILPLVTLINNHPDFYTTSSCAGRILIINPSTLKYKATWILSSHEKVNYKQIEASLKKLPEETIWMRMEPPIIHICARDMDSAEKLLKTANDAGFRRSALLSFKRRIVAEIMIPEKMDVPIAKEGNLIVSQKYLRILIQEANSKLKESRKRLKKIEKLISSI